MIDRSDFRARANLTAARYFADFNDWPMPLLIEELETLAYQMARDGDNRAATGLFILVADLSQANFDHSTLLEDGGLYNRPFKSQTGANHE